MTESEQWLMKSSVALRFLGVPHVYFMSAGPFVKIGCSSRDPYDRMAELQVACPYQMRLLFCLPGGFDLERAMHSVWAGFRAESGEWFKLEGELAEFVLLKESRFMIDVEVFNSAEYDEAIQ